MVEETSAMANKRCYLMAMVMAMAIFTGCDNSPTLEPTTARTAATLKGTFYTESPDDLIFPVKVLFAIDCSGSMGAAGEGSDPTNQRLAATWEFVERYNGYPNVSFEIMLWNQSVFRTTYADGEPGFTKDGGDIQSVLANVNNTGTTDYVGTIEQIHQDIYRDIQNVDNRDSLVRTKYIVIFFSDGLDNVPNSDEPRVNETLNAIDELVEMAVEEGVGSFAFHTFFLDGIEMSDADRQDCVDIMQEMAETGHGQFRTFQNASTIDFISIVDMRLTAEYEVKYMVAYNFNVVPGVETLYIDSDGDGLSDEEERHPLSPTWPATDPYQADTDGDGLSDFCELKLDNGNRDFDPTEFAPVCTDYLLPDGTYPDRDYDGLNDCEEYWKGTNAFHPDTDHDGIPDAVEFYAGTNPLENNIDADRDFDGTDDWLEVMRHTNVTANDPKVRSRWAYNYNVVDLGIDPQMMYDGAVANMRRYDFNISNISVMNTRGSSVAGQRALSPGDNVIRLFIAQVPEDMPDQLPVFRVADVVINYSSDIRSVRLYPADFQLLE
jgi:hypothetical protein